MIPVNIMLLDNIQSACSFAINGGKVIFITDNREEDIQVQNLPNRLKASILLPPYESTAAELDGDMLTATITYEQWLAQKECMDFIELIALAVMQNIPIGIYFGYEELREMKFPQLFMNFFSKTTGIQVGYGIQSGLYDESFTPINLGNFLVGEMIDIPTFFKMMPVGADIVPQAIQKLIMLLRPIMKPGSSLADYNNYFKDLIKQSHEAGRYLYCPIVGG